MDLKGTIDRFHYELSVKMIRKEKEKSRECSITHNSIMYLDIIATMENCTVSMLAEKLNISKSAVVIKVNELEKQGFLTKTQSCEDRRVFYITVAPQVRTIIEEKSKEMYKTIAKIEKEFTTEEIDSFCRILNAFNESLNVEGS